MRFLSNLFFICLSLGLSAQCSQSVANLNHQFMVDVFVQDFEGCDSFEGEINIGTSIDNSVHNFSKMPKFRHIDKLAIGRCGFIEEFNFLEELVSVDYLNIYATSFETLDFLSNLKEVKHLKIYNNRHLIHVDDLDLNIDSLESFMLENNSVLEECNSSFLCSLFSNTEIELDIQDNGSEECSSLSEWAEECGTTYKLGSYIVLTNQEEIDSLQSVVGDISYIRSIEIIGEDISDITSLEPLNFIDSISTLKISNCNNLLSLEGLDSIYFYTFDVDNCSQLIDVSGLNEVEEIVRLSISNCENVSNLSNIDFKDIVSNRIVLDDLPNLNNEILDVDSIGLRFNRLPWNSLVPISNVTNSFAITLDSMYNLESVQGLENLTDVQYFYLISIPNITVLSGLNNLNSNVQLQIRNLENLEFIENFGNNIDTLSTCSIIFNQNLKRISGFDNLNHSTWITINNNSSLIDISFLDKEVSIDDRISIWDNDTLNQCYVQAICSNIRDSKVNLNRNGEECVLGLDILYGCDGNRRNPTMEVNISTQTELDEFRLNFPDADSIFANVTLTHTDEDPIIDYSYFDQIKYIENTLKILGFEDSNIHDIITNIDFQGLYIVGADFMNFPEISESDSISSLRIQRCRNLISIQNLSSIRSIEESLEIVDCNDLENLSGLQNLKKVRSVRLSNLGINSLSALSNLDSVDDISLSSISGLFSLQELDKIRGLKYLRISNCDLDNIFVPNQLEELDEFELYDATIGSITGLENIEGMINCKLRELNTAEISFPNLKRIGFQQGITSGALELQTLNTEAISFPSLKKVGRLLITGNDIDEIGFFESLDSIGYLDISRNSNIDNLDFLVDDLEVANLSITSNTKLSACNTSWICEYLKNSIINPGTFYQKIRDNSGDCNTISDVFSSCGYDISCPSTSISIMNNSELVDYNEKYGKCRVLPADLEFDGSALANDSLDSLTAIVGELKVHRHLGRDIVPNLSNIRYMELVDLRTDFQMDFDLELLSSLTISDSQLDDTLIVSGYPVLSFFYSLNNDGMTYLEIDSIMDYGGIYVGGNNDLEKIRGLNYPLELSDFMLSGNDTLQIVEGFDSTIVYEYGRINVSLNGDLNICDVNPLCNISAMQVSIYDNGELCSDKDTIELVCNGILSDIEDMTISQKDQISVYPNPTQSVLFLNDPSGDISLFSGIIYNSLGIEVMTFTAMKQINLRGLAKGLYYISTEGYLSTPFIKI